MKKNHADGGRVQQKQEMRHKILVTTQNLLKTKADFALEDVAQAMNISRATIYRYFSNIDLLCTEAALLLRGGKQGDEFADAVADLSLTDALLYVQDYYNKHAQAHEPAFRKYLSVVLAESVKEGQAQRLRGARRPQALEAVMRRYADRISEEDYEKLKQIVTVLSGIEPMISNKDVNRLTNEASNELLAWALKMILKGLELDDASLPTP